MLCRTANELYWMGRHIERAENTARLLDVTYRMALLPYETIEPGLAWAEPWAVPLITSGLATDSYDSFPQLSAENVLRFMILDAANTSSIYCCLRAARESARRERTGNAVRHPIEIRESETAFVVLAAEIDNSELFWIAVAADEIAEIGEGGHGFAGCAVTPSPAR